MIRFRLLILSGILLLAILGSHTGRRIESATFAHSDFLRDLNIPFRGWVTSDETLSPGDLKLLEPDATLVRRYNSTNGDGAWAQLAVIAGHRKKSIHTPGFCMAGGGWETLTHQDCTLTMGNRRIKASRAMMMRNGHRLLATYFFTDGTFSTDNLLQFQTMQVLKRFRTEVPIGAMVRIIVPVVSNPAEAERTSSEFVQAMIPKTLDTLRAAHLRPGK